MPWTKIGRITAYNANSKPFQNVVARLLFSFDSVFHQLFFIIITVKLSTELGTRREGNRYPKK